MTDEYQNLHFLLWHPHLQLIVLSTCPRFPPRSSKILSEPNAKTKEVGGTGKNVQQGGLYLAYSQSGFNPQNPTGSLVVIPECKATSKPWAPPKQSNNNKKDKRWLYVEKQYMLLSPGPQTTSLHFSEFLGAPPFLEGFQHEHTPIGILGKWYPGPGGNLLMLSTARGSQRSRGAAVCRQRVWVMWDWPRSLVCSGMTPASSLQATRGRLSSVETKVPSRGGSAQASEKPLIWLHIPFLQLLADRGSVKQKASLLWDRTGVCKSSGKALLTFFSFFSFFCFLKSIFILK